MFKRIIKVFIKDSDNLKSAEVREAYGRFAGITGIVCNVFLFVIKIVAGFLFGSISVIADAVIEGKQGEQLEEAVAEAEAEEVAAEEAND